MFSPLTQEKIKNYVYCLRAPDSEEAFYIGKGKGNRVFDHANGNLENGLNSDKIQIIKDIKSKGQSVKHWIIRYGLSEDEAYEVEAALIDYIGIDKLTNSVRGHSTERGRINCEELEIIYGAEKIEVRDNLMIIKINALYRSDMTEDELYEATKGWWSAKKENAEKADYVLSTYNGIVRGVFVAESWYKAKDSNRIGFDGNPAPDFIKERYLHRSIEEYIKKGQANPIQYLFLDDKTKTQMVEIEEPSDQIEDETVVISEKAILIKINASYREGMSKDDVYKATRGNWKLSLEKAKAADYVFSIVKGTIIEVFQPLSWYSCPDSGRIAFNGIIAPKEVRLKYIDKSVRHLFARGEANPCKYLNI